jgi:hypothetical protein
LIEKYSTDAKLSLKRDVNLASADNKLFVLDIGLGKGGDFEKWWH